MSKGPRQFEVALVEGIKRVPRECWQALVAEDDSPFVEWDWLYVLEQSKSAVRRSGWAPCHLLVRERETGATLAACPLYLKSHSMGEFVFDDAWAEAAERAAIPYYPKLLVGIPFTPHGGRRFLTAAGADRARLVEILGRALIELCAENRFSSVHVNFCAADEARALSGLGFIERLGYQYHWRNASFASFEDYLCGLRSKRRSAVRHERAALARQGVAIQVHCGEEIPEALFGRMFELHCSTVEKHCWGRHYLTRRFFEMVREHFRRHLCFIVARRAGEVVAGTFNVQKGGVFYGRYWGCFEELKYLHFNVCYYAAIEHCVAQGLKRFEPGAGGEYKWLRGFDPAPTRSLHFIRHEALRRAVERFVAHERREVQAWITLGRERSQLKAPPPASSTDAG